MSTVNPEIKNLIGKLILAEGIYQKAAANVQSSFKDQILTLAKQKKEFVNDLKKLFSPNLKSEEMVLDKQTEVEFSKMGIDGILARLNEEEIINFCIAREEELITMYHKLYELKNFDQHTMAQIDFQRSDSKRLVDELKSIQETYETVQQAS